MTDTIAALLIWIGSQTGYDIRLQQPNIVMTEHFNMCQLYGIKHKKSCEILKLKGFYNKDLTIYLHPNFTINNKIDKARLVHELVHYVQWYNAKNKTTCLGELEVEAYRLQDKWLESVGLAPRADEFKLVMLAASCDA